MTARPEIENTLMRWALGSDRRDIALIDSCITDTCIWRVELPGVEPAQQEGRAAVLARYEHNWGIYPESGLKHVMSNVVVTEESEDSALVFSYMTAIRPYPDGPGIASSARHRDVFRRIDGRWLIEDHLQQVDFRRGG